MSEENIRNRKRFDVALSFPGDRRRFIQKVAEALAQQLHQKQVFYDRWYEAELARPNLDVYLQSIYRDEAELVVVFLCAQYEEKEWCGLEWRIIRDLIKRKQIEAVMLICLDRTDISGLLSIDGYVDAKKRTAVDIGNLIIERLYSNRRTTSLPSPVLLDDAEIQALSTAQKEAEQRDQTAQTVSVDELASKNGVDYTQLRDLLKAGKWKEADQEMADRMCEVMRRKLDPWLRIEDIQNFPCTDLRTIDHLWVRHSNGKFGFSVQKEIWQECGSPIADNAGWEEFGEVVGWKKKGILGASKDWKPYKELTFDICAPRGHLPVCRYRHLFFGGCLVLPMGWGLVGDCGISSLASRLIDCSIPQP